MRQSIDKLSTIVLRFAPATLAFLTPLFFLPTTADYFIFNKFYLVSFIASLSLIAYCIRSLVRGKLGITSSPSLLPLLFLVLASIVSSVWISPTKHVSLFGMTTFFTALTIVFITTTSSQKNRIVINSVVYGLISSIVVLSAVTILHRFEILSRLVSSEALTSKYFNLSGGVLPALAITLPVLIATVTYLIYTKNWIVKSLLFSAAIFMIVASLINFTYIFPQDGKPYLFLLPYRISWSIAVDIFKNWQTALLGSGPETYLTAFTRLRPGYLNYNANLWELRFPESGSFLLTLITTTGIIGALGFIFAFLKPITIASKHLRTNLDNPSYLFLSITIITSLISFVLIPAGIVSLVIAFVSLIALTIEFKLLGFKNTRDFSLTIAAKSEPENLYHDLSETEKLNPASLVLPWILTLLSAVLLGVYWYFAIPTYTASMYAMEAQELVQTNPVGAYMKQLDAAKQNPYNSNYQAGLSQFFKTAAISLLAKENPTAEETKNASEYMQRSIDYGKQSVLLDPYNVIAWENLADVYQSFIGVADGAQNFAISHMIRAISLDPTNPKLRLKLGILFFNLGDSDQAIKLMSQAIEAKQDWDIPYYNIALVYKSKQDFARSLQYLKVGIQYTDTTSENYGKVQEEIKALEKLIPPAQNATGSAQTR